MESSLVRKREYTIRKYKQGWSGNDIARELQEPRSTIYEWIKKYSNCSKEELQDKQAGRNKMELDKRTRAYIIRLREKWNWGPNKIEGYTRNYAPSNVQRLSHNKIYSILVEENLNRPLDFLRKTWGKKRFARLHSNSLWQTDFKLLDNDNWICTYIDDHSRFIVNGREFSENPNTDIALEIFMKASKSYGFPDEVLTDQGTEFYSAPKKGYEQGISTFSKTLEDLGIGHIVASKRRPTTIGKMEAFHKGVQNEAPSLGMTYRRYIPYWNNKRPHQELDYRYPKDVYFKDFK